MLKCRAVWWLSACTLLVGAACSARALNNDNPAPTVAASASVDEPAGCNTDPDCAPGKHCLPVDPERRLQVPSPMVAPCPFATTACSEDAVCGEGSVCEPVPADMRYGSCSSIAAACSVPCSDDASTGRVCGEFDRCNPDGHCTRKRCDDPDFVGCPASMECDPTYIWNADINVPLGKYVTYGTSSGGGTTLTEQTAAETGCVFRRCDDLAGYQCVADLLRCDPENAEPTSTGCVAIPCAELGHCSNDDYYLCTPTSTESHQTALDAHGCTYKNCEERPCSDGYTCDFESPESDASGCRLTLCNEPNALPCSNNYKCDPVKPDVNVWGCVPLQCDTDGFDCATLNQVCGAAGDPGRNIYGCVSPPVVPTATATTTAIPSATAIATAIPSFSTSQVVPMGSHTSSVEASAAPSAPSVPLPSASAAAFVGICQ